MDQLVDFHVRRATIYLNRSLPYVNAKMVTANGMM